MTDAQVRKRNVLKVLVVDDERHNVDAVRRAVRKDESLAVTGAASSEAALIAARGEHFDLFLVDYSMAGLDGVSFVEEVRKISPNSIFVMLTGYPELKQVVNASIRGIVDGILGKPWSIEELRLAIEQARAFLHMRALRNKLSPND